MEDGDVARPEKDDEDEEDDSKEEDSLARLQPGPERGVKRR